MPVCISFPDRKTHPEDRFFQIRRHLFDNASYKEVRKHDLDENVSEADFFLRMVVRSEMITSKTSLRGRPSILLLAAPKSTSRLLFLSRMQKQSPNPTLYIRILIYFSSGFLFSCLFFLLFLSLFLRTRSAYHTRLLHHGRNLQLPVSSFHDSHKMGSYVPCR